MDKTVRTYDASQVKIVVGAFTLNGYADGTFVTIKRNGDAFDDKTGADGTVDRINKNNYSFEVEVSIKRTSPWNSKLSELLAADQAGNVGIVQIAITDLSGQAQAPSVFFAPQAWIKKDPDTEYADSLGNYKWTFRTGAGANFIAGN